MLLRLILATPIWKLKKTIPQEGKALEHAISAIHPVQNGRHGTGLVECGNCCGIPPCSGY